MSSVPAIANPGPDCDFCGGPLRVIVRSKTMTYLLLYERKFGRKIKIIHFLITFDSLLITQSVTHIICLN